MRQVEEAKVGLVRGLAMFEEAKDKISLIPGARGDMLKQKFAAMKNKNPDFQRIQALRDKLVEHRYMPDMRKFKAISHMPLFVPLIF